MYKIAAIGDFDSIYGFDILGLQAISVGEGDDPHALLKSLVEDGFGIIYITEALAAELKEEIDKYKEQMLPAIILIPGSSGNTGAGIAQVKQSVEKAVGSDILFSREE